jgi:cell wall assembly regulator SMI1
MFDIEKFHADVTEIYKALIENAFEFTGHETEIDRVFVYGDMEGGNSFCCMCLFDYQKDMLNEKEMADALGYAQQQYKDRIDPIHHDSNQKLMKLVSLFMATKQEPPQSVRLTYDVKKRSLDAELSYDKVCNMTYDTLDVLERWQAELRLNAGIISEDGLPQPRQSRAARDEEYEKSFRRKTPKPQQAPSVTEAFERVRSFLQDRLDRTLSPLNPPATDETLARLEAALGEPVPAELAELYCCCDGEIGIIGDGITPSFFYEYLVPSKEAADHLAWVVEEGSTLSVHEGYYPPPVPEGSIKNLYFHPKWLPVAHDFDGNYIGIDLDPDTNGIKGQVIVFGRDEDRKFVVAQSLTEFFALFLEMLEDEEFMSRKSHPHPLLFKALYEEV